MEILVLLAIGFVVFMAFILGLAMAHGGYDGGSFALLGILCLVCLVYVFGLMAIG